MKPHLNIKREGSSWNGWCVHYTGFFKPGIGNRKITHCKAGVEYDSVIKGVEFTYGYGSEAHKYESRQAHPCFKREHDLTDGCSQCRFPTPEEIAAHDEETTGHIKRMFTARAAIISELDRHHQHGRKDTLLNERSKSEWDDEDGPTNYVSGSGIMDCPVCKTGKLQYSRASCYGHVHARCSTDNCVSWME